MFQLGLTRPELHPNELLQAGRVTTVDSFGKALKEPRS